MYEYKMKSNIWQTAITYGDHSIKKTGYIYIYIYIHTHTCIKKTVYIYIYIYIYISCLFNTGYGCAHAFCTKYCLKVRKYKILIHRKLEVTHD